MPAANDRGIITRMAKAVTMSEHVLRINAAELNRARLACDCGGVAELPLVDLHKALKSGRCCFCDRVIVPHADAGTSRDPLVRLADAVTAVRRLNDVARIEFVVQPPAPQRPDA